MAMIPPSDGAKGAEIPEIIRTDLKDKDKETPPAGPPMLDAHNNVEQAGASSSGKKTRKKAAVAKSCTELSPGQLKGLLKGETVQVLYVGDDGDEPRALFDSFPKAVLTTFSSKWTNELLDRKLPGSAFLPLKKSITINGGHFDTYRQIFYWMLSCCHGHGLSPCPDNKFRRFTTAYLIRMCANHISCDYLVKEASNRMQVIANGQIHCNDVRALWLRTPPDPEIKKFLVEHVATHLWRKSLRYKNTYWVLRGELPEFGEAINEALNAKSSASKAQKAADAAASKETGAMGGNFSGGRRQQAHRAQQEFMRQEATHGRPQKVEDPNATTQSQQKEIKQNATDQTQKGTIMLRADVVRKGVNGRPSYAKLDLASIGVTKEKFCVKK